MSTKAWIIFAAVCVVLVGGLIVLSQRNKVDVSQVDTMAIQSKSQASGEIADHVYGNKDSKILIIEYGDFQCPYCGTLHPYMKEATEKYENDVAFVFRNFPLTTAHPNARAAAAAAEAAGLLGKYWEMHSLIYDNQDAWSDSSASERTTLFQQYAESIGLDGKKFEATLNSENSAINKKISFDQALGAKEKVDGTPTVYLNGKKMSNDDLSSAESIEAAIKAAAQTEGVTLAE